MIELQKMVDNMVSGDVNSILYGICSENKFLIINAILQGYNHNVSENLFVVNLMKHKTNNQSILNVPIKSLALAVLDLIGIEKYNGNDEYVIELINNKLS